MSEYENNLRSAFSKFPTGVTVVTTRDREGTPRGFTANAFTSVSLDPPILLICIAKSAFSLEVFTQADGFAVNILSEAQREVSGVFASKRADKFSTIEYRDGPAGHPLIAGTCAWFDCHLGECVDAGDHIILLGNIADYHSTTENPLGFAQRGYFSLGLTYEAVDAAVRAVKPRISAIIESAGALLLIPDPQTGVLGLPTGDRYGPGTVASSVEGVLQALGVCAQIEFLYSVYEENSGTQVINYHGHAAHRDCLKGSFIDFADIPWEQLSNDPLRTMLQRYVREHQQEAFGLYVGDDQRGDVRAVPNT